MEIKARILVVDDNVELCENVQAILEAQSYIVNTAVDGKEALALCRKNEYDIVLVDIKLPDIPGSEVIKRIASITPSTEFIYITAHASLESAIQAVKQEHVVSYETKPLDMDRLLSIIRQVVARLSAEQAGKRAEEKLAESYRELQLLEEINRATLGGELADKIIDKVVLAFTEICHAKALAIYLYDRERHHLVRQNPGVDKTTARKVEKLAGVNIMDFAPILREGHRFAEALKTGKSFVASDPEEIAALYGEYTESDALRRFIKPVMKMMRVKNVGVIPLMSREGPLGLITFNTDLELSPRDVERIGRFGRQVASTLEKVKTVEALRESEERFRQLVENANDIIYTHDLEGNFTSVNPAAMQIYGYSSEEICQLNITQVVDREYLPLARQKIREKLEGLSQTEPYQLLTYGKEGNRIWVEVNTRLLQKDGQPIGVQGIARDITRRKAAKEEIRKWQERYEKIVAATGQIIYEWDLEKDETVWGGSVKTVLGYSQDECMHKHNRWESAIHPDDRQRVISTVREALESSSSVELQYRLRHKDGSYRYVLDRAFIIRDASGRAIRSLGSLVDVTERKRAEEAISRLSAFAEENPHPVFRTHLDGQVEYANPAAFKIMEKMGVKDKNVAWLLPRDRSQIIARLLNEKEAIATSEYRRKGHVFSSEIHVPEGGDAAHIYLTDITQRVRQEETSKRLSTVVEQAAECIIITDPKGTIQYVNPAFEKITGYSPKEVIGKNPRILKSGRQNGAFYEAMWDTLKSGKVWFGRITNRKKDKTYYEEEITISPVRDTSGKIVNYVSVARDVTQEVALEEQLRQAQKMEAVGQLAGGIAHDFNNILMGIMGYADLALGTLPEGHNLREHFGAILKKSDEAAILIRQLLAFSRKQILDTKEVDLNHIVALSSQFLQRVLRDDINLITTLSQTPCILNGDPTAIQQMITNLCVNAQDAMPDGGRMVIETENVRLNADFCRSRPEVIPGEYVKISVTDTGIGMNKDVQEHIYEPFFTTKETGEGTGLGLSTVYGLVGQHRGYIDCISRPGEGTTFDLYFPALQVETEGEEKAEVAKTAEGKETILIVEDDLDVLKVMNSILKHSGYSTLIAKNGSDGLKILRERSEDIDVVITDVFMPEMSGTELYHKTLDMNMNTRFLFITGYARRIRESRIEPELEVLQKPFTSSQLTEKVRDLLDR